MKRVVGTDSPICALHALLYLPLGPSFLHAAFSRWYHGHMSGGQAEALLQAKGEPWTFLVRESLSQPGDFVLSVLSDQPKAGPGSPLRVTHIKVMCEVRQWERLPALIMLGSCLCPEPGLWGGTA